jgi:hypothetical protein
MLLRLAILAMGVLELFLPRQIVDFWMDLAVEGDEPVELRPWVYTAARLEGLVILAWVLVRTVRGCRSDVDDVRRRSEPVDVIE